MSRKTPRMVFRRWSPLFWGPLLFAACGGDEEAPSNRDGSAGAGFSDAGLTPADASVLDGPQMMADAGVHEVGASDAASGDASGLPLPACGIPPDSTRKAKLRVTADDFVRIWFNGVLVAEPNSLWSALKEYDVDVFLNGGRRNVIAVEARNEWKQDGLDRGFIAELAYSFGDETLFVDTDVTWKVNAQLVEGWTALEFDDSAWATPAVIGKSGIPPWGQVVFNTQAEWLWAYVPDEPASEKIDKETVWFRKVFFMDTTGRASDQPPCR